MIMKFIDFKHFLKETNPPTSVMERLEGLKTLKERHDFHPEANAFEHTRIVTERLLPTDDIDLIIAGCLHDLFKLEKASINHKTGLTSSLGHEDVVASFILSDTGVQEWIERCEGDINTVMNLCKDHMRFHRFSEMRKSKQIEFIQRPHWDKLKILGAADDMLKEFKIKYND